MKNKFLNILKENKFLFSIIFCSIIHIIIFTTLSYLRYNTFNSGWPFDLALQNHWFWNSINGSFLYSEINDPFVTFGHHAHFIIILFMPIYYFFKNPLGLFFITSTILSSGSIIMYYLSKNIIKNKLISFILAITYLINPIIHGLNLEDFRFEPLSIPIIILTFYFFYKKKINQFILSAITVILIKETLSLTIAFFGIYSLILKRKFKWILIPLILGISWFFIGTSLIVPAYGSGEYSFIDIYNQYGDSFPEIITNMVLNPKLFIENINWKDKIFSISPMFAGYSLIALLAPSIFILAIPNLIKNFLLNEFYFPFNQNNHYFSALIAVIFIATILSTNKVFKLIKKIKFNKNLVVYLFIIIILITHSFMFITAQKITPIYKKELYSLSEEDLTLNELLELIPEQVYVSADNKVIAKLSNRAKISSFNFNSEEDKQAEYLLIKKTGDNQIDWKDNYNKQLNYFIKNKYYEILEDKGDWLLIKKLQ